MAVIKRIKTRRCTACKRVILIGESFETRSIGKARFYYCYSCAFWGKEPAEESGLTQRAPDVCPVCAGTGYKRISPTMLADCRECNGTGQRR